MMMGLVALQRKEKWTTEFEGTQLAALTDDGAPQIKQSILILQRHL